jgi:nicotinate-nucleotide adenylyltransferase
MAPVNISSTQLRQNPVQKYIPSSVLKYIVKNNLYIEQQVQSLMSLKRYQHSVRVAQLAVALAKSNDIKLAQRAYVAALYHDVAKEFDNQAILKLVGKYDHLRFPTIHTLHGVASAKYIEANFHIKDSLILNAIANHVIPPKNPSILDKILYCADKLEPSRTKSDVTNRERYVRLAKHDINKAFSKLHQEMINRYI